MACLGYAVGNCLRDSSHSHLTMKMDGSKGLELLQRSLRLLGKLHTLRGVENTHQDVHILSL